jgi:hypothetical protein
VPAAETEGGGHARGEALPTYITAWSPFLNYLQGNGQGHDFFRDRGYVTDRFTPWTAAISRFRASAFWTRPDCGDALACINGHRWTLENIRPVRCCPARSSVWNQAWHHGVKISELGILEIKMRAVVIGLVVGAAVGLITGVTTIKLMPPGPQFTWGVVQSQTPSSTPISWDI